MPLRYVSASLDLCRGRQGRSRKETSCSGAFARRTALAAVLAAAAGAPATAVAAVDPLTLVSGPSPLAAGCEGAPQTGTVFRNAEVEPWVDVNLADDNNLVGNWQQDRWSNGGASGNLSAYSLDGGTSWTIPPISSAPDTGQAKFSRCTGGTAANGETSSGRPTLGSRSR
jgi:hypothetical protein